MKSKNFTHSLVGNTTGKNNIETVMQTMRKSTTTIPMPVKPPRKNKIKHIYEDDDFIIDLIAGEQPMIRVSIFKDNHFQDKVFIRKETYEKS